MFHLQLHQLLAWGLPLLHGSIATVVVRCSLMNSFCAKAAKTLRVTTVARLKDLA